MTFSLSRLPTRARPAAIALLLGGAAFGAFAQYKIVGPDGRVTYTDKPPTASDQRAAGSAGGAGAGGSASGGNLPYDVRQAASRYPVALYASRGCVPCDQARQWLKGHGLPFKEYSIETGADAAALKARFGDNSLPVVTLGNQSIKGYSTSELQSYADAAGYPKQANLGSYAWPAAEPLAPPAPSQAAAAAAPPPPPPSPKIDLPPPSKNGIQF